MNRAANLIWPTLESIESAKFARLPALLITGFGAILWLIIGVVGIFTPSAYGPWGLPIAALFLALAWGLFKMWREAAIFGLVVSIVGIFAGLGSMKTITSIIMLWSNILAVKGIFAYSRIVARQKIAESA